jgi:MarR family transcriptional regulator, organic hydroperoxide resistance regulator
MAAGKAKASEGKAVRPAVPAASSETRAKIAAARASTSYILYMAARLMTAHHQKNVRSSGVHTAESFVLLELWQDRELSQGELSRRLRVKHATIGQTVRRLERNGMVERWKLPEDRRVVMTRLTEKGDAMQATVLEAAVELGRDVEAILGPKDSQAVARILGKVIAHYDDLLKRSGDFPD